LIAEKIRIPPKTKGKSTFRPQYAALEAVQKYEDDQVGGPDSTDVLIAWHQPLSSASPWNWDAITILAHKACPLLKESKTKYDGSWLEIPELMKQIVACLKDTKTIMNPSSSSPTRPVKLIQRRRARKTAVSNVVSQAEQTTDFKCRKFVVDIKQLKRMSTGIG